MTIKNSNLVERRKYLVFIYGFIASTGLVTALVPGCTQPLLKTAQQVKLTSVLRAVNVVSFDQMQDKQV